MPLVMKGGDKLEVFFSNSLLHRPHNIYLGPPIFCIPAINVTIPHRKSISMFGNGTRKTSTGLGKKRRPCIRVKIEGLKHGYKILIAKLIKWTIIFQMVIVGFTIREIHIPGIPLAVIG